MNKKTIKILLLLVVVVVAYGIFRYVFFEPSGYLATWIRIGQHTRTVVTKRAFASSIPFTGALGGIAGGDQKCTMFATNAGLGGQWMAWLSTGNSNARDRIPDVKYKRVDGVMIAMNKADLVDGTIDNTLNVDEHGVVVRAHIPPNHYAWTGTHENGLWTGSGTDCNGWTSASSAVLGQQGHVHTTNAWSATFPATCDHSDSAGGLLYCFEL